jgi:hypothetical protein
MLRRADLTRRYAASYLLLAGGALGLWGSGCTTNHDALALQPRAGSSSGGAGGGGAGGVSNGGSAPSSGGRVNPDVEPAGDNVLTIVNGIVDADSVRLCFASLTDDGQSHELRGDPSSKLDYAASLVLSELPEFSFADDQLEPWVIAGDLSLIKGLSCQDAVELAQSEEASVTPGPDAAGGAASDPALPKLRARPVAALPAGTVDIGRSVLLVLSGCMGGAAYALSDTLGPAVCGAGYAPDQPTLSPLVVKLSRARRSDTVGLQALHASAATGSLDVRASGDGGRVALVFASSLSFGSIEPRPSDTRFSVSELGIDSGDYGLQVVDTSGAVAFEETWNDVLTASGLPTVTFDRSYTVVFLGPDPSLKKRGFWNPSAFSLVDNDPTRP